MTLPPIASAACPRGVPQPGAGHAVERRRGVLADGEGDGRVRNLNVPDAGAGGVEGVADEQLASEAPGLAMGGSRVIQMSLSIFRVENDH